MSRPGMRKGLEALVLPMPLYLGRCVASFRRFCNVFPKFWREQFLNLKGWWMDKDARVFDGTLGSLIGPRYSVQGTFPLLVSGAWR